MENTKQRILITGGSGRLGIVLVPELENYYEVIAPSRLEFNLGFELNQMTNVMDQTKPDIIVHAAAFTNPMEDHEYNPRTSIEHNIIATANIAMLCLDHHIKMVYISTDYVYPGNQIVPSGWSEIDPVGPINNYGRSKLGGELAVQMIPNHLILRCAFTPRPFKHNKAVNDSIKSLMFIDHAAAVIAKIIAYNKTGIINIGGPDRCSIYEWAVQQGLTLDEISRKDLPYKVPMDTSLDTSKMRTALNFPPST